MSLENFLLTWALRRWIKPKSLRNHSVAASRVLTRRVPFGAKLPSDWRIRSTQEATVRGEWLEPKAADHPAQLRCILYLHGGAYISMSPRTHRSLTSRLAVWSDARLLALDYRLAPEHPFPAALDDALAAYHALVAGGTPASRIVVAGDSAGGGLALTLIIALRDAKMALPAGAVLFSPWTDLAATGRSIVDNNLADALLFGPYVAQLARYYLGETPATNPLASPFYADLAGLPPLLIQVSDSEVLLDDSRRVQVNALRSGVESRLDIWRGLPHGWQVFAPILPEGRAALRDAAAFIQARWSHTARHDSVNGHPSGGKSPMRRSE